MKLRLEPVDEYMHALEAATNFNESMYFNVFDPSERVGGFLRLGNRANEGYAEMTTCIYLPDGRVAFMFSRPEISDNDAFDSGGMRFEVIEPFAELRVSYEGKVALLDEPLQMANPRKAFTENPWVDAEVALAYRGVSPMWGGEPVNDDGSPITENAEEGFARGHYEQHIGGRGVIRVGDEEWAVDGYGLRDHSWGPRFWQSPWWYRWLTMNFGEDAGFVISIVTARDGSQRIGGVALEGGQYRNIDGATVETEWEGADAYHRTIRAKAHTADRDYEIEGSVLNLIPLRNRRTTPDGEQLVTRISEGMTEWRWDGRTGYGLSEYLDQIVDGKPAGLIS
ncbi:MAG: DUF7064 domain-containing protein [Acidimicrobiia bacterium]